VGNSIGCGRSQPGARRSSALEDQPHFGHDLAPEPCDVLGEGALLPDAGRPALTRG
jgi:hypothetical protein